MVDYLQEGLKFVNEAVRYDKEGSNKLALELYEKSVVNLEQALIAEKDGQRKSLISQKMGEYKTRMEQLKEIQIKKEMAERMSKLGVGTLPSQQGKKPTSKEEIVVESSSPKPAPVKVMPVPDRSFLTPDIPSVPVFEPKSSFTPPVVSTTVQPSFALPNLRPASMMTKTEAIQAAEIICSKGTEEDNAHRYENALKAFKAALDYWMKAMQDEVNPDMKLKLREKIKAYLARAEQLSTMVEYQKQNNDQNPYFQQLTCDYCKLDIYVNEDYKIAAGKNYHVKCFSNTLGLEREEMKTFFPSKDPMILKVKIPKKIFKCGDQLLVDIHIENQTSKKILCALIYVLKTETIMITVTGSLGVERKPKSRESKHGMKELFGVNSQLPMEMGVADLRDAKYQIPSGLDPSESAGPSASFVREYELIVKLKLEFPHKPVKTSFSITIQ